MQLRWLVRQFPRPTIDEVRAYRDQHACGVVAAKKALKKPDEKVLQVFDGKDWVDIPVVTVMVQEDPQNTF